MTSTNSCYVAGSVGIMARTHYQNASLRHRLINNEASNLVPIPDDDDSDCKIWCQSASATAEMQEREVQKVQKSALSRK